jgi:Ribbon-helix-helix protein, copG family
MARATDIVNKIGAAPKKRAGRPRSVTAAGAGLAPAIAVRLPLDVLARVDAMAAAGGMKRSDVIRELVAAGVRHQGRAAGEEAGAVTWARRDRCQGKKPGP